MVALHKSDSSTSPQTFVKALALTALAVKGAGAQSAAAPGPVQGAAMLPGMPRMEGMRYVQPHLAPGNASLSDMLATLGDRSNVARHVASAGQLAAQGGGGYRAGTARGLNHTGLSLPPEATATTPAAAPAGRKLLTTTGLIQAPMYGCPMAGYSATSSPGGQAAWALLDSGSSSYAVASPLCTTGCNGLKGGYVTSSAATLTSDVIEGDYGIGSWKGVLVADTLSLVGSTSAKIYFGDIVGQSNWFHNNYCVYGQAQPVNNQAIMGLAGPDLLVAGTTSYFDTIKNTLFYPGYSFAMCDINGQFFLGGYPTNFLNGNLIITPMVPSSQYLAVGMTAMRVGNKDIGATYTDFGATIVDTGTTVMQLPPGPYEAATAAIVAQSGGALSEAFFDKGACLNYTSATTEAYIDAHLPAMTFSFVDPQSADGSTVFTLTKPASTSYVQLQHDSAGNQILCAMLSNSADNPQTLLGATMMRDSLVYFDFKTNSIGFGASKGICS